VNDKNSNYSRRSVQGNQAGAFVGGIIRSTNERAKSEGQVPVPVLRGADHSTARLWGSTKCGHERGAVFLKRTRTHCPGGRGLQVRMKLCEASASKTVQASSPEFRLQRR
jgi:hypothetical protein